MRTAIIIFFAAWTVLGQTPPALTVSAVVKRSPHPISLSVACDPALNAAGYEFDQGSVPGKWTNSIIGATNLVQFTNLPPAQTNYFSVIAFNAFGQDSSRSPTVSCSGFDRVHALGGTGALATAIALIGPWTRLATNRFALVFTNAGPRPQFYVRPLDSNSGTFCTNWSVPRP